MTATPPVPLPTARTAVADLADRFGRVHRSWWTGGPRSVVDDWHREQLAAVLEKVSTRSPFYRRHLAGADLSEVRPDDLRALPFTTKDDLRRELDDVLSGDLREAAYYYETTGTTGRPTPCPRDEREILTSNANVAASWRAVFARHFGRARPVVGLMGPTEIHSFGDTLGDVARDVGACAAKIWPYSPVVGFRRALELLRDLRVQVVVATPGVLLNLARAAEQQGVDLHRDLAVEVLFVTGEICTPALAAGLDDLWGATTYDVLYGSQEALVMGVACPSRRLRFAELNYLPEVLDPATGEVRGSRGRGELCVTMLTDGIKPLVRYRTGDLVHLHDAPRGPGELPGPVVEVLGRVADGVPLGEGSATPAEIETAVLEGVRGCLGYQVLIDVVDGHDHVTVRLQLSTAARPTAAATVPVVRERVAERFGVTCDVEVVDELDGRVSTGAFVSWKAARVVDRRRDEDHEARVATDLGRRRGIDS